MLRKHEKMTDVAIEVLKVFRVPGQDRYKVLVRWWNIGLCHAPWCMGIVQKLDLTGAQWRQFKPYQWLGLTPDT